MAGRRGLVVPQNTFLDSIIKKTNGAHEHFLLASAEIMDSPIVYCSDGFTNMTGYKKNQVVKKKANCSFMYGSLTTKDTVRLLRNAIQEKQSAQIEIVLYKRDATPFWVLLNIGLVYNELDEDVLFLLTFQDISEFKEAINPSYRKHRWSEFNKSLHTKPTAANPISKAKEEKNRVYIAQLKEDNVNILPGYQQEIPDTPRFVILHCSTAKIIWDWFILIFILYTATSVPFIVCFKFESDPMTIADTAVDVMFLIDIVLNFHTSYVGDDGSIIFDLQLIRRNYFRSWFFVDLITSLPYGLIGLLITGGLGKGITDLIGFLKAIRLLRLNRVVRALDQYLEYGFITLILWMLFFCLCAHWMACIFFAIAEHYDKFDEIGWVHIMSEQTMQPLVIVNGTVVQTPTLASLYMSSLYFSLTSLTSIGFGNIAPNTTAEKIFSCVTMIFGGLCYAVIFGQVTAIVQQSQKKSESYHQTLDNMRSFCKLYNVPKEIATRIVDYYMYTWVLNRGVDTNQVLQNCPKDLQSDICIHLNRKIIDSTPAFGELSNAVLRAVARNFAIHRVAPGERMVHEGESLDTVYFIASGSFEVTKKGKVVGLLGEGDVFGDDVCRFNDVGRSAADVFALTYANVHAIGRDELLNALAFYPEYGYQFAKAFRLSYSLRDEVTMRKLSSHPRAKSHLMPKGMMEGRRYSIVEEMQHAYDTDSNNGDLGTPNSQNMTDTDPPSKPFLKPTKPRLSLDNGMEGIPEDTELDPIGDDEDLKRWNDYHNTHDVSKGLLVEITGMKSEVRREIEMMGGKMNQLEQNISAILALLREQGLKSPGSEFNSALKTPEPVRAPSSTAGIISRVKSELPEEILPDWVEMENFGMAGVTKDDGTLKQEETEEKNEEEEVKSKKIGGRITKKRKLEAKRKKKKAEKAKHDSEDEHEAPRDDELLDAPPPEYIDLPEDLPAVESLAVPSTELSVEPLSEPQEKNSAKFPEVVQSTEENPVEEEKPKKKKKKGDKSSKHKNDVVVSSLSRESSAKVDLEMSEISHQNETQDNDPEEDLLNRADEEKPGTQSSQPEDNKKKPKKNKKSPSVSREPSPKPSEEATLENATQDNDQEEDVLNRADGEKPDTQSSQPEDNKKKRKKKKNKSPSVSRDPSPKPSEEVTLENETQDNDQEEDLLNRADEDKPGTQSSQPDDNKKKRKKKKSKKSPSVSREPSPKPGTQNESAQPDEDSGKLDSPRPETPTKHTEENEPQSQPAQPDEPNHLQNDRWASPVPLGANTARTSSARSQSGKDNETSEENTPVPEENSFSTGEKPPIENTLSEENNPPSEERPPTGGNTPRVQSPKPDNIPPSRKTGSGDVALTIEESDEDDFQVKKKEKPTYVE